ncbi:MAG: hypothetical protein ACO3O0_08995, partial [Bacteroidia bacterium]
MVFSGNQISGDAIANAKAEAEAMALSLGLSPTEAAKFKQRVAELKSGQEGIKGMELPSAVQFREGATANSASEETKTKASGQDSSSIFGHQIFRDADIEFYDRGSDAKAGPD